MLFLTGPPLKMFLQWLLPTIWAKFGIEGSDSDSKSDSDIPIFVTELQIPVHITRGHVNTDDNGNGEQGYWCWWDCDKMCSLENEDHM